VAQNWDWKPECAESTVILHAVCEDGVEFMTLAEAGTLARSGMSSTGVAVAGNFLASDQDFGRSGIPIPFIRRAILRSGSIDEALELVASAPRAFSSNHLVADASGRVVDCETSPESTFLLHPADGLLAHSNHFCSPEATKQLTDTGIARYPDTLHRHTSARARLEESAPEVTPDDVKDALSNHHGHPHSVCRHLSDPPAEGEIVTVASVVMDVTAGHMWVSDGRPCEQGYEEYSLISKGHADAR
jgi:isopenicillin-N N-acyltransferase-like protein